MLDTARLRRLLETVASQLGLDLHRSLERRQRSLVIVCTYVDTGHELPGLGVAIIHRQDPPGERQHLVVLPLLGEHLGHRDQRRRVVRVVPEKVIQHHHCFFDATCVPISGCEKKLGLRNRGVGVEHDLENSCGFLVVLPVHQVRRITDRLVEMDLVLRIGEILSFGRGGGATDITERRQHAQGLLVEIGLLDLGSTGLDLLTESGERAPQTVRHFRFLLQQVFGFRGIPREVVEFFTRGVDELVLRGAHAVERAPAVLEVDRHRLRVGIGGPHLLGVEHQRHQRFAVERVRRLDAHQVEYGRQDIDGSDLGWHPNALEAGTRHPDDQRHLHGGVVDEIAVLFLTVIAEAFPMITNYHHDRVISPS